VYVNAHHSWVAGVPILVVVAVRLLSTRRNRTHRRPGAPVGTRGFTSSPSAASGRPATGRPVADDGTRTGTAPGWFRDPFVRHEQRYWSGTDWTEHVLDGGTPAVDPPPPPRG